MSEFVLCGDALVRPSSARIASEQVSDFRESAALLSEAKVIAERAREEANQARQEGYEAGKAEALAEMRDTLAACTAKLREDMAAEDARREREASIAAMEAVEQLIGARDDAATVTGLVRETLRRSGAKPARIIVSPQWVEAVRRALPEDSASLVGGDPDLEDMGCRIEVEGGRIIADLGTQMAALRARWDIGAHQPDG